MEKFKKFLEIVSFSGNRQIENATLQIEKKLISVCIKSPDTTAVVKGSLKRKNDSLEIVEGKIGVNLKKLISYLNMIENAKITVKKSKVIVENKNQKATTLLLTQNIDSNVSIEKFDKLDKLISEAKTITIDVKYLQKIKEYLNIVNANYFTLILSKNKLEINAGDENSDHYIETIKTEYNGEPVIVKLKQPFLDVIANIEGKINITLKKDNPVKVDYSDENTNISIIVAQVK